MRKFVLFAIIAALLVLPVATVYAAPPEGNPGGIEKAIAAQEAHNPQLLSTPGVVGTAVGLRSDGKAVVKVYTERSGVAGLPKSLDGIPVEVQITGKLFALQGPPAGKGPPPNVNITSPVDGATFESGVQIWFEGTATDKQDGDLAEFLQWHSSIDGTFEDTGSGFGKVLSDGSHTITASVTNSNSRTGESSVTINVGDGGVIQEPATTDRWGRPVPIGISTGNEGACIAGTIGARVTDGTNFYALSNNHVYALENAAPIGSEVLQPGLYDTGCVYDSNNVLGTLSTYEPLLFNNDSTNPNTMDAALALTTHLLNETPSSGYGAPNSTTEPASLDLAVQKFGRTTELTEGIITAINWSGWVNYDSGLAYFEGQIIIESQRGPFLKAGDSGSLVVTRDGNNPVGLLFAGNRSGKMGIANDIDIVLARFDVTIN